MAWVRKKSQPASRVEPEQILVGLDLNATRARAVHGTSQAAPRPLPLEGNLEDLPLVISCQGRHPELGRAGAGICRQSPHLICSDFLASLGEQREWAAGRHRLNAAKAVAMLMEQLRGGCAGAKGLVIAVPAYLTRHQVVQLTALAEKARLPLTGTVKAPLAHALTAYAAEPWSGFALVLDADDHAFTAATVIADGERLVLHGCKAWAHLNLGAWKGRLLDRVADRCVRQSRRDPRDSAPAEQSLYEQIEDALDVWTQAKPVELLIQTVHWYQNLLIRPEETVAFCDGLIRQVVDAAQSLLNNKSGGKTPQTIIVSRAAGRLPGLVNALQMIVQQEALAPQADPSGDFGEDLIPETSPEEWISVLNADAAASAAHDLATRFFRGQIPRGHVDHAIAIPAIAAHAADRNPTKKSFRLFSSED